MRAIGGRRRCSAREHCTGAPIPNGTQSWPRDLTSSHQALLSNRTQITPPSDSDGGEIESGLLLGPRVKGSKAIASIARSIALRSPYDLQGNRTDRSPIAPSVEEGDRNMLLGAAPIAQLHPVRP